MLLALCQSVVSWVNESFDEYNDKVNQFDWYAFPMNIQRVLPMILNFIQQPIKVTCFGRAACDRDLLKYVSLIILKRNGTIRQMDLCIVFCRWSKRHTHIIVRSVMLIYTYGHNLLLNKKQHQLFSQSASCMSPGTEH